MCNYIQIPAFFYRHNNLGCSVLLKYLLYIPHSTPYQNPLNNKTPVPFPIQLLGVYIPEKAFMKCF